MSNAKMGQVLTNETKQKMSVIGKKHWKDLDYVSKMRKAFNIKPTGYEKKIIELNRIYKLGFEYVGDFSKWIGNHKNPDFINEEKKLIIETYGKHWHEDDYEKTRAKIFDKYGYKTLFLNDDDLLPKNWEEICLNKIMNLCNSLQP